MTIRVELTPLIRMHSPSATTAAAGSGRKGGNHEEQGCIHHHGQTYTSLRDLMATSATAAAAAAAAEFEPAAVAGVGCGFLGGHMHQQRQQHVTLKNRLLKQAARAYLFPKGASALQRPQTALPPFLACFSFAASHMLGRIAHALGYLIGAFRHH